MGLREEDEFFQQDSPVGVYVKLVASSSGCDVYPPFDCESPVWLWLFLVHVSPSCPLVLFTHQYLLTCWLVHRADVLIRIQFWRGLSVILMLM